MMILQLQYIICHYINSILCSIPGPPVDRRGLPALVALAVGPDRALPPPVREGLLGCLGARVGKSRDGNWGLRGGMSEVR